MRQLKVMIPKAEFVKLRKVVLDYLKRNGKANGHSKIRHDDLENFGRSSHDMRPFAGMSPTEKSLAATNFWNDLLKNKLVKRCTDVADDVYYHLPQFPAADETILRLYFPTDESRGNG